MKVQVYRNTAPRAPRFKMATVRPLRRGPEARNQTFLWLGPAFILIQRRVRGGRS